MVVVGAGLAGLAAAQRLYEAGIRDVIVLDAQSRIGGRIDTISHSDYLVELGAQWLHGADENPLYDWLVDKNMLDDFEDATSQFGGVFCTSQGEEINQRLVKRVVNIMMDSKLSLSKNRLVHSEEGNNAAEVFKDKLDLLVENDDDLKMNKKLVYAIFEWFLRYETIENSCDSMDEVSTASYTDWTDWGDGTLLNFKHGYRSLLYWFCNHMPTRKWIHLNKEVTSIEILKPFADNWLSEEGQFYSRPMIVKYRKATSRFSEISSKKLGDFTIEESSQGVIECDHVVVTVSLGFLKQHHETLFKPQLPQVKRELINSIGFGTVNKIVLEFERPFWNNDHGIKLVWENENDKSNYPKWVEDIIAFDVVRRQPNLLIGWVGGYGSKLMEEESDEKVGETCLRLLENFLPLTYNKPTKLIACICSRWNSNPYVCGSYSFQSMRSFNQKVDKLHEPLYNITSGGLNQLVASSTSRVPRVLFAGEATAGKLYSTTHGAIITGWREADRLRDHLLGSKRVNIQQTSNQQQYTTSVVI